MQKTIHVAVAVITREHNGQAQVLISKRPEVAHQGGLWEFPGGKVELGESVQEALVREIEEELGLRLNVSEEFLHPLIRIPHDYGDKRVLLEVWHAMAFEGQPKGLEGQPVRWVSVSELGGYEFPAANVPILSAVRLPRRLAITPELESLCDLISYLETAFERGFELVQVRQHAQSASVFSSWVLELKEHFGETCVDLHMTFNRPVRELNALGVAQWHLSSHALRDLAGNDMQKPVSVLSASCHDEKELLLAQTVGCDYALLSPVRKTQSHPNAIVIGLERFGSLVGECCIPVYALGGLSERDWRDVCASGAQGVAAIRGWGITARAAEN